MGKGREERRPLAWQGTLAEMRRHGTRVAQCCSGADCRRWTDLDVRTLIDELGEDHRLWNRRPACSMCGAPTHFMASPGPSTPFRPLAGGAAANAVRQAFLKSFGFTPRDVRRIKAMAEATTANELPKALDDLDVPFRVGACMIGREGYSSGKILGEWAGRSLLYWDMHDAEAEAWRRKRRTGPKAIPSMRRR